MLTISSKPIVKLSLSRLTDTIFQIALVRTILKTIYCSHLTIYTKYFLNDQKTNDNEVHRIDGEH